MTDWISDSSTRIKALIAIIGVGVVIGGYVHQNQAMAEDVEDLKEIQRGQTRIVDRLIMLHEMQANQPVTIRPPECQVNADCVDWENQWCDTTVHRCKDR
jgi:hypothetical protein